MVLVVWPRTRTDGRRAGANSLLRLAEALELVPDHGDRGTWFDAEQAVRN